MSDRYGRWQNSECLELKGALLKLEEAGTGRVRLNTFYKSALEGINFQLHESVGYLRQLGALDESQRQQQLSVIIPNYVNSLGNCVANSKFYAICCIDECKELVGHLESHVAAPEAPPERISELVSALPSTTVQTPRTLAPGLVRHLEEIANQHGGVVPLHGRLFAQWMHHAYPRECPYPHVSGTTMPVLPEKWEEDTGEPCFADDDTMLWYVEEAARNAGKVRDAMDDGETHDINELPWSTEEELVFSSFVPEPVAKGRPWGMHLLFVLVAVVLSMSFIIWGTALSPTVPARRARVDKFFV